MIHYTYWATVVENVDPDGLNRVRVSWKGEEDYVTEWVSVVTPYGGHDTGVSFLPSVGDQVLVASFDPGNTKKAVIGSIWSNAAAPPRTGENTAADLNEDGKNSLRHIKSKSGNQLIFDDTEGNEKIQIITADGKSRIEFKAADNLLSLDTEHTVRIDAAGSVSIQAEEVEISSSGGVNISADTFQIDAEGSYENNASDGVDIEGSGIALN